MIITIEDIIFIISAKKIKINGCLHVGAHECEELFFILYTSPSLRV